MGVVIAQIPSIREFDSEPAVSLSVVSAQVSDNSKNGVSFPFHLHPLIIKEFWHRRLCLKSNWRVVFQVSVPVKARNKKQHELGAGV